MSVKKERTWEDVAEDLGESGVALFCLGVILIVLSAHRLWELLTKQGSEDRIVGYYNNEAPIRQGDI